MITLTRINWFVFYSFIVSVSLFIHAINWLNSDNIYQGQEHDTFTKLLKSRNKRSSSEVKEKVVRVHDYYGDGYQDTTAAEILYFQNIPECRCSRKHMYPPSGEGKSRGKENLFPSLNSSCSDEGTFYQPNQNVVAFSLYLTANSTKKQSAEYFEGLLENLEMMRRFYPGYSLRLYTNIPLSQDYHCSLVCSNQDLFWCFVRSTPSHGDLSAMVFRTWRFLPMGDPTVDVFLPRDLDSLISFREWAVLDDWKSKGDKAIYLMRDKNASHDAAILAGMWGASNKKLGMDVASKLREEIILFSKVPVSHVYKTSDQQVLKMVVFNKRPQDIVAYDSYSCVKWAKFTEVRPFPTEREDPTVDFVGNLINIKGGDGAITRISYDPVECPMECRPEYGKDWTFC